MNRDAVEQANRKRDRRLRRRLLEALAGARVSPRGGLHGRLLRDIVDSGASPGQGFESDDHAIGLLRSLKNKGLIDERDQRSRQRQVFGLDFLFYALTATGGSLLEETIDADPDIDDERNLEE